MRPCHGSSKSKGNRRTKAAAVKVLDAAGLGLSLASSASASTMPTAYIPQTDNTSPNQRFVLGEEEMADIMLDQRLRPAVAETPRQPIDHPDRLVRGPQRTAGIPR